MSDFFQVEEYLRKFLLSEHSSLSIQFNRHAGYYETAQQAAEENDQYERWLWVSPEEREKAVRENSIWVVQWYPRTPRGSHCIGASTLEACLRGMGDVA